MEKDRNRPADRIKQLAQFYVDHKVFRGVNVFEGVCGLSKRYIKNLCATEHGNPGVDTIIKIYRTFEGINLHWLVLGDGDMFTVSDDNAVRYGLEASLDYKKEQKVRSVMNNKILKGMTREEKMELMERILNDEK